MHWVYSVAGNAQHLWVGGDRRGCGAEVRYVVKSTIPADYDNEGEMRNSRLLLDKYVDQMLEITADPLTY
jgi:hypothetical protein